MASEAGDGATEPPASIPVAAALSDGLISMLTPMVDTVDASIQAAVDSQAKLSHQIDRVAAELQTFLSASQLPSFAPYAQRLTDVRRRTSATNNTLVRIQARLSRIEEMAERLSEEERLTLSRSGRPPKEV